MAIQQDLAVSSAPRIASAPWARLAAGFSLCVAIAAAAVAAADFAPIIGAPVIAIAMGVIVTNTLRGPLHIGILRVGDVSKLCLKGGIILLGASLDLGVILRTGAESLPVLLLTIGAGLVCALLIGRTMSVHWRMRCLIGIGTTICGASAIAALAPVVRAKAEEIAYAISVIFFFNMLAVFAFPTIGHLMGLSDFWLRLMGRDCGERHVSGRRSGFRLQPRCGNDCDDRQAYTHHVDHPASYRLWTGDALV